MRKHFGVICGLVLFCSCAFSAEDPEKSKYELSNFVKAMMGDKVTGTPQYLSLKKYARNLDLVSREDAITGPNYFPGDYTEFGKIYRGEMPLNVNGKRFLAENMQDRYSWVVYIAGSNAQPEVLFIKGEQVASNGGPSYFVKAGITWQPIACDVIDSQNFQGYYFASAPGKFPVVLQIGKSSGSGGVWYTYGLFWRGPAAKDLPKKAIVGECAIRD